MAKREDARKQRDFGSADALRTWLRQGGVELNDRDKTWSCTDGRRGQWGGTEQQVARAAGEGEDTWGEAFEHELAPGDVSNPRFRGSHSD